MHDRSRWNRAEPGGGRLGALRLALLAAALLAAGGVWRLGSEEPLGKHPEAPARDSGAQARQRNPQPDGAGRDPAQSWPELSARHLPVSAADLERLAPSGSGWLSERAGAQPDALRVTYSLHPELQRRAFELMERGRVERGHILVADARSGRIVAYAASNAEELPPTRTYPAASLVKIVTAAAALRGSPELASRECRFRGNPYRLTRARIAPPQRGGSRTSFRRALARSNNQCFAQLAVHALGRGPLLQELAAFGWLARPAPGHSAGRISTGSDPLELGRLGSGLAGSEITPLHALQLALFLAQGRIVEPYWIERIATAAGEIDRPPQHAGPALLRPDELTLLRELLTETTQTGTARRAFRLRSGRPLLAPISVAGKTGSLSGANPEGRYEWFVGVAPADEPRVAIAVLALQGKTWWTTASQLASELLKSVFCRRGECWARAGEHWLAPERSRVELPRPRPATGAAAGGA